MAYIAMAHIVMAYVPMTSSMPGDGSSIGMVLYSYGPRQSWSYILMALYSYGPVNLCSIELWSYRLMAYIAMAV